MRYIGMVGLLLLFPSFVFAQIEGNVVSYFANKKFDSKTISTFLKATEKGNQKVVNAYLTQDSSIANVSDNKGNTALMYAAKAGNVSLMKVLTNNGAKVNTTNDEGNSTLCIVLQNQGHYKNVLSAVNLLLNLNAHPNTACSGTLSYGAVRVKNYTPLHYAVKTLQPSLVDALIKHGADVNAKAYNNKEVVSPLDMIFYANGESANALFAKVTLSLVNAGAKSKQYSNDQELLMACTHASGHYDAVLDVLLTNKAISNNINSYKLYYGNPLTDAVCYHATLPNIKVLVKHGAKVSAKAEVKQMLQCASRYKDDSVSNYLNQLGYK